MRFRLLCEASLHIGWNIASLLSACVGNMKNFPTILTFKKLKGVYSAVMKGLVDIESIVAPDCSQIIVSLYHHIPDRLAIYIVMRCADGRQQFFLCLLLNQHGLTFFVTHDGSQRNLRG